MEIAEQLRAARRWTLIVLLALVPIAFDTDTFDVFNLTKFTIVLIGALVVAALWIVEAVQAGKVSIPKTGVEVPLLALLAATALATLTSFSHKVSLLGFYKSYDGLFSVAAFTLLALAAADVFETQKQIRQGLFSLAFIGGGAAIFYGILQYVTFSTEGRVALDWEKWGQASFKTSSIFSTMGNPNHLAGFLVVILPLAIGLALATKVRAAWIATAIFSALAFIEVLQVQTRGAWVAVVLLVPALIALFWPEARKRPLAIAAVGAALLLAFAFTGVALKGRGSLWGRALSMTSAGDSSSMQRVLLWESGLNATRERPVTGWGPDTFRVVFLWSQTRDFVDRYGPMQVANGPHNVFISWLYATGLLGFAAFMWLVGAFGRIVWASARRALEVERDPPKREARAYSDDARSRRILIGCIGCAVLAFLAGEAFNVNQIGLSFVFWMLLGMGGAMARSNAEAEADAAEARASRKASAREARGAKGSGKGKLSPKASARAKAAARRRREPFKVQAWAAAALCAVAILVLVLPTPLGWVTLPYRADRVYRYSVPEISDAKEAHARVEQDSNPQLLELARITTDRAIATTEKAASLNTWEARYRFDLFEMHQIKAYLLGRTGGGPEQTAHLEKAAQALLDAQRLSPRDERYHRALGDLYVFWALNATPPDRTKLDAAVDQLHMARQYNPYDFEVDQLLFRAGKALGNKEIQIDAAEHGYNLDQPNLAVELAQIKASDGDRDGAIALLEGYLARFGEAPDVRLKLDELKGGRPAALTQTAAPAPPP